MRKLILLIILPLLLCTLPGCWDQKIYEDIGFMLSVGVERSSNGLLVSYVSPLIDPEQRGKLSELASAEDVTLTREAREKARSTTLKSLEAGMLQQYLISRGLAETGIDDLLTIFQREASNSIQPYLVIVDGSPKELFKNVIKFENKPRPSIYLKELLEHEIKSSYIPDTKIYNYDINCFSGGTDSIIAMIKLEPEKIKVTGTALFHIDKMVGEIDTRQTSMLLALMGKMKNTEYICKTIEESRVDKNKIVGIAVALKNLKRKIKVTVDNGKPIVNLSLEFKANCDEGKWGIDFLDRNIKSNIEKNIEKNIKDDCILVLDKCQQVGSDPIGIGDILRANYPDYWNKTTWLQAYQNAIFNVDVKVHIDNHGLIN